MTLQEIASRLDQPVSLERRHEWCEWAEQNYRPGETAREFVTRWALNDSWVCGATLIRSITLAVGDTSGEVWWGLLPDDWIYWSLEDPLALLDWFEAVRVYRLREKRELPREERALLRLLLDLLFPPRPIGRKDWSASEEETP